MRYPRLTRAERREKRAGMIASALLRAFPDLLLPGVRGVMLRTLLLTALLFAGFAVLCWWGIAALSARFGWSVLDGAASAALAVLLATGCGWLLFRTVAMAVVGLFSDRIVTAVEAAHFPARHGAARPIPIGESIGMSLRSVGRALLWNGLALPLYLVLLPTGVGPPLLFLLLNGYLLGRDLADLVEPRHPGQMRLSRAARWQLGLASALIFLIPVVNLLAPLWSVAMAVHLFHRREALAP